jgi:hypothetical protein
MFVRYFIELSHRVAEATVEDVLDRLGAVVALSQSGSAARMPP